MAPHWLLGMLWRSEVQRDFDLRRLRDDLDRQYWDLGVGFAKAFGWTK